MFILIFCFNLVFLHCFVISRRTFRFHHLLTEAITTQNSNTEAEETSAADQNEKEMTLGDQLNQAKETPIASVEELHNLAGGADIKVHIIL